MTYVNPLASKLEAQFIKKEFNFSVGDTVDVAVKVVEGEKTRLQSFVGTVLAKKNRGVSSSFIVRKISYGVSVERTFPLHSPLVDNVKVMKRGKVRKAKLYNLRDKFGKSARIAEKLG